MVAATTFFLMESMNVSYHWKTSMNVGALVTDNITPFNKVTEIYENNLRIIRIRGNDRNL